jgi:hypothetical protein
MATTDYSQQPGRVDNSTTVNWSGDGEIQKSYHYELQTGNEVDARLYGWEGNKVFLP